MIETIGQVQDYLTQFGYLEGRSLEDFGFSRRKAFVMGTPQKGVVDARTKAAIEAYQSFNGLAITGELDEATLFRMEMPRCGFPDAGSFVLHGNKWDKRDLTYGFHEITKDVPALHVIKAFEEAFLLWTLVANLTVRRVDSGIPDMAIRFVIGSHGDGFAFDGPGKTLAHAFFAPPNGGHLAGDAHFDDAETWSTDGATGIDLVTVAAHEIGHALGLAHSKTKGALMYPFYSGPHRFLHADDIAGVRELYGPAVTPAPPKPVPPPPEPKPEPPVPPDGEWPPFAIRRPGPASKSGGYAAGNSGPKRGEVKHSAVGFEHGMWSVLDDPNSNASWHYSVMLDGRIFAHYPLTAHTWHGNDSDGDGGVRANLDLVGIEHEGGEPGNKSSPLTEAQVQATIKLTRWCAEQSGFTTFRRYPEQSGVWTLVEHNEVGNSPTACPSNRIPWARILGALNPPGPPDGPPEPPKPPVERDVEVIAIGSLLHHLMQSRNGWGTLASVSDYSVRVLEDLLADVRAAKG